MNLKELYAEHRINRKGFQLFIFYVNKLDEKFWKLKLS